ncbi:ATP-dependent zinc protease [Sulfurospirillum sp. T05]|uniref:ATP-dependent zinc protease n=1 Tax=Sulfurospirillum tamanense TaxID=2813362 RepID=A0ABS2WNX1_9BACT|nr:RimK/LysX family protein [Sulfurospirillum tamanensis]MBN2963298.1 ATP-dependent zinc protease [Sulfurospirillum tamanensis]
MSSPNKAIIGRVELVALPAFGLEELEAKVDTGADSSALHCTNIALHEDHSVSFHVLDVNHPSYVSKPFRFPIYALKKVKSSNGISKKRAFIKTEISIHSHIYPIVLSLTDRSDMSKPMLLGRKFLEGLFLVDVALKHTFKQRKQP